MTDGPLRYGASFQFPGIVFTLPNPSLDVPRVPGEGIPNGSKWCAGTDPHDLETWHGGGLLAEEADRANHCAQRTRGHLGKHIHRDHAGGAHFGRGPDWQDVEQSSICLLYTSPSPRD